jgi:hypothetical protein
VTATVLAPPATSEVQVTPGPLHSVFFGIDFHIQTDFGFNDIFSHVFYFLHHNGVEASLVSYMNRQIPVRNGRLKRNQFNDCNLA